MKTLEALFTPADFSALKRRNLDESVCVVFDVFRATSSIVTALSNGAEAVIPAAEISEAIAARRADPGVLLAGERDGLRIRAELSGGIDFDLGNSPREFTRERVAGRTIVTTTTNGTRALRACAHARQVLIGSFLNLKVTADFIRRATPSNLIVVCSGTFEQAAYEDVLAAGALCDLLWDAFDADDDLALMARMLYRMAQPDLLKEASGSRNGRRLLSNPDLCDDVPFTLQIDACPLVAVMDEQGRVRASALG
jgi:2-phosphosulfolactate phosphatase